MLELLFSIGKWLVQAAVTYAASDEGGDSLKSILDEAERDGIDVPFYEPSEEEDGLVPDEQGDIGSEELSDVAARKRQANYQRDIQRGEVPF